MASALRLLLLAASCCQAAGVSVARPLAFGKKASSEKPLHFGKKGPRRSPRALVATMVQPDDEMPVDIMMEHHLRMISGNRSILDGVIIDNRPPWMERGALMGKSRIPSTQDPLLSRYRRSQGTTGSVQVKDVDYSRMTALMSRFFDSSDLQLSLKVLRLAADAPTNISKLDEKGRAARLLGMLNFLESCADADDEVDMCIFLDSTTFLYRENQTGLVEMAAKLFQQDPMAVVLQPPDMCMSSRATAKGVCKVGNSTTIKHGLFVVNRDRLEGFAPMPVESAGLGSVFEDIFQEGLKKGDHEGAVKQMRCGGAFFVHPYDRSLGQYACPHKNMLDLPVHARETLPIHGASRQMMTDGHFDADYSGFPRKGEGAAALQSLIDRIEAGKLPEAKYPESVTNKCSNMCPSRERISQGLAW